MPIQQVQRGHRKRSVRCGKNTEQRDPEEENGICGIMRSTRCAGQGEARCIGLDEEPLTGAMYLSG